MAGAQEEALSPAGRQGDALRPTDTTGQDKVRQPENAEGLWGGKADTAGETGKPYNPWGPAGSAIQSKAHIALWPSESTLRANPKVAQYMSTQAWQEDVYGGITHSSQHLGMAQVHQEKNHGTLTCWNPAQPSEAYYHRQDGLNLRRYAGVKMPETRKCHSIIYEVLEKADISQILWWI